MVKFYLCFRYSICSVQTIHHTQTKKKEQKEIINLQLGLVFVHFICNVSVSHSENRKERRRRRRHRRRRIRPQAADI